MRNAGQGPLQAQFGEIKDMEHRITEVKLHSLKQSAGRAS
jgi:hypothetical protein